MLQCPHCFSNNITPDGIDYTCNDCQTRFKEAVYPQSFMMDEEKKKRKKK